MLDLVCMNQQAKDEVLLKKISLRIKEIREQKGVSQENFFNNTGIHIARIELAKLNVSISTLSRICEHFEMSLAEFFEEIK